MGAIQETVEEFVARGAFVLSPADPRIVDQFGDFVFVASDRVRRIRTVQGRHLAAIGASDFLWLVAPDGYIGQSAAMEIGYAAAREIPVFSGEVPTDLTLRQWVTVVSSPAEAMRRVGSKPVVPERGSLSVSGGMLLEPAAAIEASHDDLLVAQGGLLGTPGAAETEAAEAALHRIHQRTALPF